MARAISRTGKLVKKRGRGRPRKDPTSIHLTLLPDQLAQVDAFARTAGAQSRPDAIRTLLGFALTRLKG